MNADKLAFRDRFRAKEVELADNLINLALAWEDRADQARRDRALYRPGLG
jgi:hypothetical protein